MNMNGRPACPPAARPGKRKRGAKDDSHNSPEAQERWVRAANHPDADDLAAARTFVQKMEHKMDLLEKFRRAQEARKAKS